MLSDESPVCVYVCVCVFYTSSANDGVSWMNLADSMRSQDNINNVISLEREK